MGRSRRPPRTGDRPSPAAAPQTSGRAIGLAFAALAALLTVAAAFPVVRRLGGWMPAARAAPNILLITLDTTRADHLFAYGYRLGRTTHLDRLASEGVVFERA